MQTVSDWSHILFLISPPFCLIKRRLWSLWDAARYQYNSKSSWEKPTAFNQFIFSILTAITKTRHLQTYKCEKSGFTPILKNIPASSHSLTLIWSGCVGLSIINVPEENRRSPFTPPRLQHKQQKNNREGSVCLPRRAGSCGILSSWPGEPNIRGEVKLHSPRKRLMKVFKL